MTVGKLVKAALATATAVAAVSFAAPTPAQADGVQVTCGTNVTTRGFGLYYNSGNKGSKRCIRGSVYNYGSNPDTCSSRGCAPYYFEYDGRTGQGESVKNQAASAYNYDAYHEYIVYFNSGFGGPGDQVSAYGLGGWYRDLGNTYNNNASQNVFDL
ncbi:hypothetical protein AB0G73_37560 [Streptomyces sp. NPDC020719]|uniref:hypothetical protein n=1 Tax=Streptomyces sp. NPDC020719 TaxID=3154896 RepID=UPI0033FC1874